MPRTNLDSAYTCHMLKMKHSEMIASHFVIFHIVIFLDLVPTAADLAFIRHSEFACKSKGFFQRETGALVCSFIRKYMHHCGERPLVVLHARVQKDCWPIADVRIQYVMDAFANFRMIPLINIYFP